MRQSEIHITHIVLIDVMAVGSLASGDPAAGAQTASDEGSPISKESRY